MHCAVHTALFTYSEHRPCKAVLLHEMHEMQFPGEPAGGQCNTCGELQDGAVERSREDVIADQVQPVTRVPPAGRLIAHCS